MTLSWKYLSFKLNIQEVTYVQKFKFVLAFKHKNTGKVVYYNFIFDIMTSSLKLFLI